MWYACRNCPHTERIWNSRDGVTPFCLECPSCGELSLQHVAWQMDAYRPNHKPNHGQQFFRDGTPDEAAEIMRKRLDSCKGTRYKLSPEEAEELIEKVRSGKTGEFQTGWPTVDRNE